MCGRLGLLSPSQIAERFALEAQLSFDRLSAFTFNLVVLIGHSH